MNIKEYVEMGEKRAGKQAELARILGVRDSYLRQAKLGKSGLPDAICILLARYIEVEPIEVIAASNLVTEKDETRRKIFESCFSRAATITAALSLIGVTSIMTPSPANASQAPSNGDAICIM